MNQKFVNWLLVLIWCGAIFCFTASPAFTGDNTAHWIKEIMEKLHMGGTHHISGGMFSWNYIIRKLTHITVFGILAVLFYRALKPWRFTFLGAWILTVLYAASDEWHQSFQPNRSPEVTDVMIDACGAVIALIIYKIVSYRGQQKNLPFQGRDSD